MNEDTNRPLTGVGSLTDKEYKTMLKLASSEGTKILDKNTLSSRGGTGFAKVLKQLYAGKSALRQYNNAMNEIQALIDEINKAEREEREKAESLANAIKKSKAQYLAFIDSDDLWMKDKVILMLFSLNRKEDWTFFFSHCQFKGW